MNGIYLRWLPWIILLFPELFCMVQASLQLSTGILFEPIMKDFAITAFSASILNSVYYYMYVGFQIPAGFIMDHQGPRRLLFVGSFICCAGCILFSLTSSYALAIFIRIIMGGAASFAFLGVLYLIREWFSAEKQALLVAITENISMVASIRAVFLLGIILHRFDWRVCMQIYGLYFLVMAIGCGLFIKNDNPEKIKTKHLSRPTLSFSSSLMTVFRDKTAWLNGIYAGLMYTVVTVFVALWAIPFLMIHLGLTSIDASKVSLCLLIGTLIGCPVFGWLSQKFQVRRAFLMGSGFSSAVLLGFILYWPHVSILSECVALFLLGISSCGYVLPFLISDDISPDGIKNTYTGFTNACCMITAPILQPLIGALLDIQLATQHTLLHYQRALGVMVAALLLATIVAWLMPETFGRNKTE